MKDLEAKLEALLFVYGEPMAVKKAAQILEVTPGEIEKAAETLGAALKDDGRGLALVRHSEQLQLVTKPDFSALLEKVVKAELHEALTTAALETLSIIAYGGPILRSEIDYIRGVNSSFILRSLLLRGLIDRNPDPKRGNAFLYSPSFEFLKHIGVANVSELPEYKTFAELAMKVKQPGEPAAAVVEAPPAVSVASPPEAAQPEPAKENEERKKEKTEDLKPADAKTLAGKKKKEPSLSDEIAEMFAGQQKAPEGLEASEFDGNPEIE